MKKCKILDVNIDVTNMDETVKYIIKNLQQAKGNYICISNVHTTVMAYESEYYKNIQNSAFRTLPDGRPLSIISRKKGYGEAERVTGPDLMGEIFKLSEVEGYTHFFYGSTEDTLETLQLKLMEMYPNLKIVGTFSPPFRELSDEEDKNIIDMINSLKPDFVWVGLGAPKQEIWMYMHKNIVQSLMIGVGAGFDYYAGKIKRAPKLMQDLSLEWLFRFIQAPKKLGKRYAVYNSKFILYLIKEAFK